MTAPDPRLDEIQARLSAATPGPWEIIGGNEYLTGIDVAIGSWDEGGIRLRDAEFIANAPADVPYLLAELRKAHEALERVEGVAGRLEARAALNARVSGTGIYDDAMQLAADAATSIAIITATDLRAAVAAAKGDERG